jgi:hypothetical protein
MGMTYAFSEDENPDYTSATPANVPSKLDPIPTCWGPGLGVNVVIGRTEPLAAHDLNGDSKGDIVWRDTSGDVAFWLMNGAAVSSTGGVGGVSTRGRSSASAISTATAWRICCGATRAATTPSGS